MWCFFFSFWNYDMRLDFFVHNKLLFKWERWSRLKPGLALRRPCWLWCKSFLGPLKRGKKKFWRDIDFNFTSSFFSFVVSLCYVNPTLFMMWLIYLYNETDVWYSLNLITCVVSIAMKTGTEQQVTTIRAAQWAIRSTTADPRTGRWDFWFAHVTVDLGLFKASLVYSFNIQ